MLISRNAIVDVPILSLQTGTQLGIMTKPIIDPRNLMIMAFYCKGPLINFEPAILHVEDIREFSDIGAIVDGSDVIMPPDDLVRLKEVMDFHFELDDKLVIDESKRKLGRVESYLLDSESFYILKLNVKPSLLHSFAMAHLSIDRSQIIDINDKAIIVQQPTVEEREAQTIPKHAIENPFRRHRQAETAHKANNVNPLY